MNLLLLADGDLSVLDSTDWKAVQQLRTMLLQYEDKKEFSTTQNWLDCVEYAKMVNNLLKDAMEKYGRSRKKT